jgi:hypothetical protein
VVPGTGVGKFRLERALALADWVVERVYSQGRLFATSWRRPCGPIRGLAGLFGRCWCYPLNEWELVFLTPNPRIFPH